MSKVTDPAKEIVDMCNFFGNLKSNPSSQKTYEVIAGEFSGRVDSIHLIMDVYGERLREFADILDATDDEFLDEEIRTDAREAAKFLEQLFNLANVNDSCSNRVGQVLRPEKILQIRNISPVLRRHSTMSQLSSKELEDIRSALINLDAADLFGEDVDEWVKLVFLDGIEDILIRVNCYEVFGSSSTLSAIYKSALDIQAVESNYPNQVGDSLKGLKETLATAATKLMRVDAGIDKVSSIAQKGGKFITLLSELSQ
ncbi:MULTISPECIES: hypothetical protein [unclassified Thalassospira]|uniref:hypothetical protein n=1 Tax=unclassified Thalassospira TaxID=2648997 RepID=UPI0007A5D7CD|nr:MULTISPECIES: hypothetical protein [unclassified Thalassospira]KZD02559.1 hypothetical protein AUQ41_03775 [Thalassospira sp. MCCC 1A02898]ONH89388.1 hypothetical protein TH47_02855 [Thalassospira sp. MCCC 1A02803]